MSGSSLDGLDIAFVQFEETAGRWSHEILAAECLPYPAEWIEKLQDAVQLNARDYVLLDADYGHYIGQQVKQFIASRGLEYQVALVASHGHTTFHMPPRMTGQIGQGAAIAAETGLPVVTDLRAVDVALGGQGAPIVPMGERLLWKDIPFFLNIGGIANVSLQLPEQYLAFDVCPANRVLNLLAGEAGKAYDEGGKMAAGGQLQQDLLDQLNALPYFGQPYPKSLANDFGTDVLYPLVCASGHSLPDRLHTFTEHIAVQVASSLERHVGKVNVPARILVTGGGALNSYLVARLRHHLEPMRVEVDVPDALLVNYKEALIMALLGVLRWREENTVLASVTGARQDSIGGALWVVS